MDEKVIVQHNWFAVIPAEILLNNNLSDKAKLLFALVANLSNEKGFCYATNKYLAEKLNCSKVTISRVLGELEEIGFINRVMILKANGDIEYRAVTPLLSKMSTPPIKNDKTPLIKNEHYNNKDLKTKNNKKTGETEKYSNEFEEFFDLYHKSTGLSKTDKEPAFKHFKKLTEAERKKAVEVIPLMVNHHGKNYNYFKKARTYLSDKNFNDEFKAKLVKQPNF